MGGWTLALAMALVVMGAAWVTGCQKSETEGGSEEAPVAAQSAQSNAAPAMAQQSAVERGQYLVNALGCDDCHTPHKMGPNGPEPDLTRRLSGAPADTKMPPVPKLQMPWAWVGSANQTTYAGPWGVSYAANLTPDKDTGLGTWTADVFVNTIRRGKILGVGRPVMPPMPWQEYRNLSDADLKAMFAYLQTLPPVKNKVPLYQPPAAPSAKAMKGKAKKG